MAEAAGPINPGITEDLLFLYELSLTIGRTSCPQTTCRDFLRVLVSKRRLAGASVWWFDPEADDGPEKELVLLDALPRSRESSTRLPPGNALWAAARGDRPQRLSGPECAVLTAFEDDPVGACALLPLGGQGVLKLDSAAEEAFNPRELAQLRAVVAKLATAIQGGLALARVKRSEAALREKTEELDRYFTSSLDLLCIADTGGRFVRLNPEWTRVLGYPAGSLEGRVFLDFVHPDDLDSTLAAIGRLASQESVLNFVNRYRHADGNYVWMEWRARPVGQLIYAVARDISERRRMVETLRESESKLLTILDGVEAYIYLKDFEGRYLFANRHVRELWRAEMSDIVGQGDERFFDARTAADIRRNDRRVLDGGETLRAEETNTVPETGKTAVYLSIKLPLRRDDGSIYALCGISTDITSRIEAEATLADREAQLRTLIEALPDSIQFKDGAGRWLVANSVCLRLFGLADEAWRGRTDAEIAAARPDLAEWLAACSRGDEDAWRAGGIFPTEERGVDGAGEATYFDVVKVPLFDDQGGRKAMVIVGRDVTPGRRTAEALKRSEERAQSLAAMLRLLCDNVPDLIWAKDLHKRYLFANKAICEKLLGAADTSEPIGKDDLFFARRERESNPENPAWHTFGELCQDSDAITLAANRPSVFEEFGNVRGEFVCLDVHKSPFINEKGEVIGTVGSARDVTEKKRIAAELEEHRQHLETLVRERTAALLETEARASHILRSSADGLYGVDTEGRITFINPAACALLGLTPEAAIGRSAHALFHHHRADGSPYPAEDCRGRRAVMAGQQLRVSDEVYWHADGRAIPVMYAVHPIEHQGAVSGAVISFVDMSEQWAAASAREQALTAAENLARVRSEFLANMSHEIRTPLNGVLGFAKIGWRRCDDRDKARDAFEKIMASGNRLLAVVNEILDFSKIEAGKLRIDPVDMVIAEVVDHAVDLVHEAAARKGLELAVDWAPGLPAGCLGDPLRTGQILLNLLSNAVKFTESGGIRLSVFSQAGRLHFRVADTGIGISPESLGLLFNPFQQADGSASRRFGGTGLGLAISKRLLELMGGDIRVDSAVGRGSTFEFSLPLHPASRPGGAAEPEATGGPGEARSLAGLTILVAEDDPLNQLVLRDYLRDAGATVVLAANGRAAVDQVIEKGSAAFDLVLMDIQMPEMDGYEATRRILELVPGLPIVGQTAHALAEEREKCLAAGMADHIAKPIDADALLSLVLRHAGRPAG